MIIVKQKFTKESNLEVRFVSEAPRQRLINFCYIAPDGTAKDETFLVITPWVHYQWTYMPHLSINYPWIMERMYFSPVSLDISIKVSEPCLPNFYTCRPCVNDETGVAYTHYADPLFIECFWSEAFNYDGDLLVSMDSPNINPVWKHLLNTADEKDFGVCYADAVPGFRAWEKLNEAEVIALPWAQDVTVPT